MGNRTGSHTPTPPSPPSPGTIEADVAVVGGGVIGHGIAWEVRRSGRSVVLIDDAPGSGASWAAAGMLAPVSELHYQEEDLLELMLDASARWRPSPGRHRSPPPNGPTASPPRRCRGRWLPRRSRQHPP